MKIAVIDADLLGRSRHRFPNLACMKLSGYHKEQGHSVDLKLDYNNLEQYDKVYVSKVFTDTPVPESALSMGHVEQGGTGFFFDKAPALPYAIEHHMPDYHLYDSYVNDRIASGIPRSEYKSYLDYSIGFLTRGCFRKCGFCVNRNYDRVFQHSPLEEFFDPFRPKICLLDDNFFGYPKWRDRLLQLQATGKRFTFKQGLDERLLTDEKCALLCRSKYDGAITFAFDRLEDYRVIEKKLQLLRNYTNKRVMFYVLVGYDSQDEKDIESAFLRIELLMKYRCIPYIMRFESYKNSPYRGMYIALANWCNQKQLFLKTSFREFCYLKGERCANVRYMTAFERAHPQIASRFFDLRFPKAEKTT